MANTTNRLTNANIYIDGNNMIGKAEEVDLPSIAYKFMDHNALGLIGSTEFFSGIEKMEARVKWNSFYVDAMKLVANPTQMAKLQLRSSMDIYDSNGRTDELPYTCFLTVNTKNFPTGQFRRHENAEFETSMAVYALRLEVDGEEIYNIDVQSSIFKINGVDIMSKYRSNLGI